jgi:hypothetical protein
VCEPNLDTHQSLPAQNNDERSGDHRFNYITCCSLNKTLSVKMDSSEPSNKTNVAGVLKSRGFLWSSPVISEVLSKSTSISFDEEWNKFIEVVKHITGINFTTMNSQAEVATIASERLEIESPQALNTLRTLNAPRTGEANIISELASLDVPHAVTTVMTSEGEAVDICAWNFFKDVIGPANRNLAHCDEKAFDSSLFEALRESLNVYVNETVESNWIVLKNSIIGFGRGVERTTLGFKKGYVLSGDSKSDHSCFVLGSLAMNRLKTSLALQEKQDDKLIQERKCKASKHEETKFWFNDLTSTVDLKFENSSCEAFAVDGKNIHKPKLGGAHGPMGQAIMHTMDSWHCLVRRGISAESIPVVVLAGKNGKLKTESTNKMVCCLEAHVQIPQYFGMEFKYSIDRIISFNGTSGLFKSEIISDKESRDKRAIAIYIKTMRIGLENAIVVMMNRHRKEVVPLVSLCCRNLLNEVTDAQLIASPISREEHQYTSDLKVSQGELFQLSCPTKGLFSRLVGLRWFVGSKYEEGHLTNDCIVKVSCAAVHNFYVPPGKCNDALTALYIECITNSDLKTTISKVLLGFCFHDNSMTLASIMKDLQTGDKPFTILEHQKFQIEQKLSQLWDAFCELVNSLLLPMADVNVVHLDIRSTHQFTYNILVSEMQQKYEVQENKVKLQENTIELCLIDFESLALSTAAAKVDEEGQNNAICMNMLGTNKESAYHFLFWQILWIAYRWMSPPSSRTDGTHFQQTETNDSQQTTTNTNNFVFYLFDDSCYVDFKIMLGDHYETLKDINLKNITKEDIQKTLVELKEIFDSKK